MAKFSDTEISALILEKKLLQREWTKKIQLKDRRSGKEGTLSVEGEFGSQFKMIIKQSKFSEINFCLTLGVYPLNSNTLFRLLRYDGKDAHSNKGLPGDLIDSIEYEFHIHRATERYQDIGLDEEHYAEPTTKYSSLSQALDCMIKDCNFILPEGESGSLFGRINGQWQ